VSSPAHISLAPVADLPSEDGWQFELPQDPVAAAEYLRGMERARELELESIRRLRERIEGNVPRRRLDLRKTALIAVLLLAIAGSGAWLLGYDRGEPAPAHAASDHAGHAGHAAMGSGVAVALATTGPTASHTQLAAGPNTLILRNGLDEATTVELEPVDGTGAGPTQESASIGPGRRMEWAVELTPGSYMLCVLVDGKPVMGDTLTVA
jgi:hypothetical protein